MGFPAGKHCQHPTAVMGVVDKFGQSHFHDHGVKKSTLNVIKKSGGLSHPDSWYVKVKAIWTVHFSIEF